MWTAATFDVAGGFGQTYKAHGYTEKGLGLDMVIKPSPKGRRPPKWRLIHLNTGHAICYIDGVVADAFPVATEIANLIDWDFDGLYGWRNRDPDLPAKMKEIAARHKRMEFGGGNNSDQQAAVAISMARAS